jgi:hypothetical protein
MPDELHTLACVLGELQLAYHPGEDAGVVWVGGIYECQEVAAVPEIRVEGNDTQTEVVFDRVAAVVQTCFVCLRGVYPTVVFSQAGDVVVVPGLLLAEETGKGVGRHSMASGFVSWFPSAAKTGPVM